MRDSLIKLLMQKGFGVEGATIAADHLASNNVMVQKRGRWIGRTNIGRFDFRYECSACRGRADLETSYCPHCGAKMDGGADNA